MTRTHIRKGQMNMSERLNAPQAALAAGVIAGLVDVGLASMINATSPIVILQAIASGVLGMKAYSGGVATVLLGLVLQLAMSIVIAGIYAFASKPLKWLRTRPVAAGIAFGCAVFAVMNFIVVPLSAFGPKPTHISLAWVLLNVLAMLIFGIIVASIVRWQWKLGEST
jgi:hypothetical protein